MGQEISSISLSGKDEGFDRAEVLRILSKGASREVDCCCCEYVDGSRGECYGLEMEDPGPTLDDLSFSHFGGRMMMERIFELADAFEVMAVWTDYQRGGPQACVTRADRLVRMTADYTRDLLVVVARDPSHFNQLVRGATFEENGWV